MKTFFSKAVVISLTHLSISAVIIARVPVPPAVPQYVDALKKVEVDPSARTAAFDACVQHCFREFRKSQDLTKNATYKTKKMSKQAAEHHTKAAEHHEHAARHHKESSKHHTAGHHEKAAHHAHTARAHHLHAQHHAEEATKHHATEHGSK